MFATFAGMLHSHSLSYPSNSALVEFFSSTYGFTPGVGGLAYLGLGIGFILAVILGAKFSDQLYKYVGCLS